MPPTRIQRVVPPPARDVSAIHWSSAILEFVCRPDEFLRPGYILLIKVGKWTNIAEPTASRHLCEEGGYEDWGCVRECVQNLERLDFGHKRAKACWSQVIPQSRPRRYEIPSWHLSKEWSTAQSVLWLYVRTALHQWDTTDPRDCLSGRGVHDSAIACVVYLKVVLMSMSPEYICVIWFINGFWLSARLRIYFWERTGDDMGRKPIDTEIRQR